MHETPLEQSPRGAQPCHTSDIFVQFTGRRHPNPHIGVETVAYRTRYSVDDAPERRPRDRSFSRASRWRAPRSDLDDEAATSERRQPVLWLVLEENLSRAPPEDLVEGLLGSVLRQSWRVGEPVFCEAIERVGPGLDVERLVCYQGIFGER